MTEPIRGILPHGAAAVSGFASAGIRVHVLRLKRQLPAAPDSVQQLRQWAVAYAGEVCELNGQLHADIALCVSEAATNAIQHAYTTDHRPRTIELEVYQSATRLVVQVIDEGVGIDETQRPGTGLRIISQLANLTIAGHGRGTTVTMAFPCPTPADA
jgi:anti-sigma regulatory factor (Ser/Thr protein kinase)